MSNINWQDAEKEKPFKVGGVYKAEWMPTKYLYSHTGKLLRDEQTTIVLEVDIDHEVRIQKKFLTHFAEINEP